MMQIRELTRLIHEMKIVLYGDEMSEPHQDACAKLTQEFFKEDILRLLITYLPNLDPGVSTNTHFFLLVDLLYDVNGNEFGVLQNRQDITHVIANLQRQRVHGHYVAAEYLEKNTDLLDMLIPG